MEHRRASSQPFVVDTHNDLLMAVQHFVDDPEYFRRVWLPQLKAGHVAAQVLPVWIDEMWVPESALRQTLLIIETALRTVERNSDALALCLIPGDVESSLESGRMGIVLALEGCPAVGRDLDIVRILFRLGVRVASLTHFGRNTLADGSAEEATQSRLTRLGLAAVQLMQELGMVVDISHLSLFGTQQVLEITKGAIMASHSSCDALHHHHRNLPDQELRAIAETGGVIGINFYPPFISDGPASIEDVVDHIEHAVEVAGIGHVGLGPDFIREAGRAVYGDNHVTEGLDLADYVPGLEGPADFPALADALDQRGFTRLQLEAVMGGNFRRFLNQAIGTSARILSEAEGEAVAGGAAT
ncbi:MAG: dipeptidase [Candidatus Dormibacteria bacterium]